MWACVYKLLVEGGGWRVESGGRGVLPIMAAPGHWCVVLQVTAATNRMTVKSEANVAASLALIRLIILHLSEPRLEAVTKVIDWSAITIHKTEMFLLCVVVC